MKGAKTALISPMRRKRRLRLVRGTIGSGHSRGKSYMRRDTHASTSSFLFRSVRNALRTCPSRPNKNPSKQNPRFHSNV
jgi:hypothetical protein